MQVILSAMRMRNGILARTKSLSQATQEAQLWRNTNRGDTVQRVQDVTDPGNMRQLPSSGAKNARERTLGLDKFLNKGSSIL